MPNVAPNPVWSKAEDIATSQPPPPPTPQKWQTGPPSPLQEKMTWWEGMTPPSPYQSQTVDPKGATGATGP